MAPQLSKEIQKELADQVGQPLRVVDPSTQRVYVLVAAEMYERLQLLLGDGFDIRETYAAQEAALAKVWNDADLDDYAEYDRHKQLL